MTYKPHLHMQFQGDLGPSATPIEQWSINLRAGLESGVSPGPLSQSSVDSISSAMGTFIGAPIFMTSVKYTGLKVYEVDAAGHAVSVPTESASGAQSGSGAGGGHPWQCSLVMTHDSIPTVGKGTRGRVFLPPRGDSIDTSDLISVAAADTAATAYSALLDEINLFLPTNVRVCIASRAGVGRILHVRSIRVGRVVDTQRRRRRSVAEAYVTAPVAP